jgi:pSer/pThr/pTyr-binding forkhead associated (FHA) protein
MIGRSDPTLAYKPDIDLRDVGEIGRYVSRRHARIIARQGRHFVEEVGSTSGTRLNGSPLQVGAPPRLLNPGDQLSLGGCVIAYEWRLLEGEA